MSDQTNQPIRLASLESFEKAKRARLDEPFFVVLPRPQYPNCDHTRAGFTLDSTRRTVSCRCGAAVDVFDALMFYARAERRLISTREAIEANKKAEADKKREQEERKPCLREVNGYVSVFNPAPPNGNGALIGFNVRLSPCGHTVRWPSRGRRRPKRHLTCDVCLKTGRAKLTGQVSPARPSTP